MQKKQLHTQKKLFYPQRCTKEVLLSHNEPARKGTEIVILVAGVKGILMILKKIFLFVLVITTVSNISAQTTQIYNIDSLKQILSTNLHDTNRIWALNNLGRNIQTSDTTLLLAKQALELCHRIGFKKGEAEAYANIGYWFNTRGNYPKALESYLRSIQLSESVNYEPGLKRSFNSISTVYIYIKDYKTSLLYARKARGLSIRQNDLFTLALSASWMAKAFIELQQYDSALKYAQESYEAALKRKDPFPLYMATARLGEVNDAENNHSLALEYFRLSLLNSRRDGRYFRIAGALQQLADEFKKIGPRDSSLWYAQQTFKISKDENLMATLFSSSLLLSELYEGVDNTEGLRYHKLALAAQDSLFSQEKNHEIEALNFTETLRQQEMEVARKQAEVNRKNNLQYAGIAFGLVVFLILFLLLSHSIVARPGLIKFLGVLALLIVFEFINLLLGPLVDSITDHSPILMLVTMVCIAALLIPVHNHLDKWVTQKLVEKNKRIRLAAAKKIIASLEPGQDD
jgi:tetratricopeptide (TPR) repeat protein